MGGFCSVHCDALPLREDGRRRRTGFSIAIERIQNPAIDRSVVVRSVSTVEVLAEKCRGNELGERDFDFGERDLLEMWLNLSGYRLDLD